MRGKPMRDDQPCTLPEAVGDYASSTIARFHMPGHKGRSLMGPLGAALAPWDITEIAGMDNLHAPDGVILTTEQAYAQAYGARHSFLLVGGSTAGILAMLLSLGKNKRVLLARDCHKSAIAGIALAGHTCDFIYPEFSEGHPFAVLLRRKRLRPRSPAAMPMPYSLQARIITVHVRTLHPSQPSAIGMVRFCCATRHTARISRLSPNSPRWSLLRQISGASARIRRCLP